MLLQSTSGFTIASQQSSEEWLAVECTSNCGSCSSSLASCTECTSKGGVEYYLFEEACLEECPLGYYGSAGTCLPCEFPCLECQFGAQLCTKCSPEYEKPYAYREQLSCFAVCPNGTYLDTDQSLCVKCASPCYTCASEAVCLSCDITDPANELVNYHAEDNSCYETCPSGTFTTLQRQCIPCTSPCTSCSDQPDLCLSCEDGLFLFGEQCLEECPEDYEENFESMRCDKTGEMSFPVPFTIIAVLVTFLLLLANFMRNKTRFYITLMTLVDGILKLNWLVLFVALAIAHQWVALGIISYCLVANFLLNFFVWRIAF
mmetsp:Transcript_22945/g.22267  ORF Transcript_22945/g.22267 Transcript_22945/m.22267 type:complete len:317 (+) Transcript_22945:109-1059(+)